MSIDRKEPRPPNWTDEHLPLSVRRRLLADELIRLGCGRSGDRPKAAADRRKEDRPARDAREDE